MKQGVKFIDVTIDWWKSQKSIRAEPQEADRHHPQAIGGLARRRPGSHAELAGRRAARRTTRIGMVSIADRPARGAPRARRREWLPAVLIGLATLASLAVVALLAVVMWLSFVEGTPGDAHLAYTLRHYSEIFLDSFTYRVIGNTLQFSAITLAVALALGLPMAYLLERTDFPAKRLVFTMLTVALLIPAYAVAMGWVFLLNPRIGLINTALRGALGLASSPFNISTIAGMGIVEGLALTPVTFVMTAIVFRSMDASLEEAARMSGAKTRQTLWRMTLPVAWPGILAASIYVFTIGFAAFDVPAIIGLTNRIFTFSTYVYLQVSPTEGLPQYGGVAALSMFMLILAVVLSWWYGKVQSRAPRFAVVTGKNYKPSQVKLGRWRWAAVAFVAVYFLFAQLLPVLTLIWSAGLPFLQPVSKAAFASLSFGNFRSLPHALVLNGLRNTVELMLIVPTITVTLSVAVSWVVLRSRLRFRQVYDFFAFLPHTVPAIVFSVAAWLMALFVLRGALPIYGTIWILVLVYVVATLSYGSRMTNSALIQLHRELEESATVSGAGLAGTMRSVVVPLLLPAMMYAWIWIALLAYRELTLPVVLSTSDNQPLSVVVWSLVLSSSYGQGSAVAVSMLVLLIPILALYWTVARRTGIAPQG